MSDNDIDGKRYIFVVDDEEPIRKVLNTHLAREGFEVITSCGGAAIFDTLRSVGGIDLIISDIRMPEVDGIRILEFVRENMETVPVVMLTGLTDINLAIDVMKKGAFDFLMKPVRKEDLMVVVRKALSNHDLLVRNKELEQEKQDAGAEQQGHRAPEGLRHTEVDEHPVRQRAGRDNRGQG